MNIKNKILHNQILVSIIRFFRNLFLEYKYRKYHLLVDANASVWNCKFGKYNLVGEYVYLYNSTLGDFTYVSNNTCIFNTEIGKFCSIAQNVSCGLGKHPTHNFVSTHPAFFSDRKQAGITFVKRSVFKEYERIVIGNDVWIGANATILDGVNIQDGAIVGAGSVVTKNVPAYAIVGGVPAKIIRYRYSKREIKWLLSMNWWNKETSWLINHAKDFSDINKFINSNK